MSLESPPNIERPYTKQDVKQCLQWCAEKYGEVTSTLLAEDDELPIDQNAIYEVGWDMNTAREAAGVEGGWSTWSREAVIESVEEYAATVEMVTFSEFCNAEGAPSKPTVYNYFDSTSELFEVADIPSEKWTHTRWDRDLIIETFQKFAAETDQNVTTQNFCDSKYGPSPATLYNEFDTSQDLFDAANIERVNTCGRPHNFKAVREAPDSSQYVYITSLDRSDGERFYYVGSVNGGKRSLSARLSNHKMANGHHSAPVIINGERRIEPQSSNLRQEEFEFNDVEVILPVESQCDGTAHLRAVEKYYHNTLCRFCPPERVLGGH